MHNLQFPFLPYDSTPVVASSWPAQQSNPGLYCGYPIYPSVSWVEQAQQAPDPGLPAPSLLPYVGPLTLTSPQWQPQASSSLDLGMLTTQLRPELRCSMLDRQLTYQVSSVLVNTVKYVLEMEYVNPGNRGLATAEVMKWTQEICPEEFHKAITSATMWESFLRSNGNIFMTFQRVGCPRMVKLREDLPKPTHGSTPGHTSPQRFSRPRTANLNDKTNPSEQQLRCKHKHPYCLELLQQPPTDFLPSDKVKAQFKERHLLDCVEESLSLGPRTVEEFLEEYNNQSLRGCLDQEQFSVIPCWNRGDFVRLLRRNLYDVRKQPLGGGVALYHIVRPSSTTGAGR